MPKTLEAVSDNMNTFLWLIFMWRTKTLPSLRKEPVYSIRNS
jgi:hypothetical protein